MIGPVPGEWWKDETNGVALLKAKNGFGSIVKLGSSFRYEDASVIEPCFFIPSDTHLGELRKPYEIERIEAVGGEYRDNPFFLTYLDEKYHNAKLHYNRHNRRFSKIDILLSDSFLLQSYALCCPAQTFSMV